MATRREETTRKGFTDVLFLHKINQLVALSYQEGPAPVAKPAPYGTSKTVGAVPQPKEDANVERSEVEITENLNDKKVVTRILMQEMREILTNMITKVAYYFPT